MTAQTTPLSLDDRLHRAVRDALRALPSAQFINLDSVVGVVVSAALAEVHRVVSGPATTDTETTTRVFAALHRSAEQDVSRVIDLYERWVKAGPPPLGTSIARWWDARLVELHDAILPPTDQTKEK